MTIENGMVKLFKIFGIQLPSYSA